MICEFVAGENIDCAILIESWLRDDPTDAQRIGELTPTGYKFYHKAHKNVKVIMSKVSNFTSFEYVDMVISMGKAQTCHLTIYCPPPSAKYKAMLSMFCDEFSSLLEVLVIHPSKLVVVGDFTFHVDNHATKLLTILNSPYTTYLWPHS